MEEGTIIAARILDGYYFYRQPANADGCTFSGGEGMLFYDIAPRNDAFFYIFGADFVKRNDFREHKFYPYFRLKSGLCVIFPILRIA